MQGAAADADDSVDSSVLCGSRKRLRSDADAADPAKPLALAEAAPVLFLLVGVDISMAKRRGRVGERTKTRDSKCLLEAQKLKRLWDRTCALSIHNLDCDI